MRKKEPKIHHTSSRLVFLSLISLHLFVISLPLSQFSPFLPCCFCQKLKQGKLKVSTIGCNDLYVLANCAQNVEHLRVCLQKSILFTSKYLYVVHVPSIARTLWRQCNQLSSPSTRPS